MDLFQKFKEQKLLDQIPKGKIVLAVSGGADSVALLHLMRRLSEQRRRDIFVVHVQHQLRGQESIRDQKFVESFCGELKVSCMVKYINPGKVDRSDKSLKNKKMGLEARSRVLRYRELGKATQSISATTILTAHTANDQAETFFLNLMRGTGTDGLCGILPVRALNEITMMNQHSHIFLFRPLLPFSRQLILEYIHLQKLKFCEDSSNRNLEFRRNWVRHKLIPLIQKMQPKIINRISDLSAILRIQKEWVDQQISRMEKKVVRTDKMGKKLLDLNLFFRYHVNLRAQFLHSRFPQWSYQQVHSILAFLKKEKSRKGRFIDISEASLFIFPLLKKNRIERDDFILNVPGISFLKEWGLKVDCTIEDCRREFRPVDIKEKFWTDGWTAYFDADKLKNGYSSLEWKIRSWRSGDRFVPFGMQGSKKIHDFFIDEKIAEEKRAFIPLLEVGNKIRWIIGFRTDNGSKIDGRTKHIVCVKISPDEEDE